MRQFILVCTLLFLTSCSKRELSRNLTAAEYIEILKNDSRSQRRGEAVEMLLERHEASGEAVAALLDALKDDGMCQLTIMQSPKSVGERAAHALAYIGGDQVAVALAERLLTDEVSSKRAVSALWMMDRAKRRASLPVLLRILEQKKNPTALVNAATVLETFDGMEPSGADEKRCWMALSSALNELPVADRKQIIKTMNVLGKGDVEFVVANHSGEPCDVRLHVGSIGQSSSAYSQSLNASEIKTKILSAAGPQTVESIIIRRNGTPRRHDLNVTLPGGHQHVIVLYRDGAVQVSSTRLVSKK